MKADRRTLLKGSALLGAAAGLPLAARGATTKSLTVFDSRLPESAAFARTRSGQKLDLHGANLRDLAPAARIDGLTGWSDWIDLRGELELRGLRLVSEHRVTAPLSGKTHLFRWSMVVR